MVIQFIAETWIAGSDTLVTTVPMNIRKTANINEKTFYKVTLEKIKVLPKNKIKRKQEEKIK